MSSTRSILRLEAALPTRRARHGTGTCMDRRFMEGGPGHEGAGACNRYRMAQRCRSMVTRCCQLAYTHEGTRKSACAPLPLLLMGWPAHYSSYCAIHASQALPQPLLIMSLLQHHLPRVESPSCSATTWALALASVTTAPTLTRFSGALARIDRLLCKMARLRGVNTLCETQCCIHCVIHSASTLCEV